MNSLDPGTLCGPVHSRKAVAMFEETIICAENEGGEILYGGKVLREMAGNYVVPTIISLPGEIRY